MKQPAHTLRRLLESAGAENSAFELGRGRPAGFVALFDDPDVDLGELGRSLLDRLESIPVDYSVVDVIPRVWERIRDAPAVLVGSLSDAGGVSKIAQFLSAVWGEAVVSAVYDGRYPDFVRDVIATFREDYYDGDDDELTPDSRGDDGILNDGLEAIGMQADLKYGPVMGKAVVGATIARAEKPAGLLRDAWGSDLSEECKWLMPTG